MIFVYNPMSIYLNYIICTLNLLATVMVVRLIYALYSGSARADEAHPRYPYMQRLSKLQSFKPRQPKQLPGELSRITTPLKIQAWREGLQSHPDTNFSQYVIQGIREGFKIGFNRETSLKPCAKTCCQPNSYLT